MSLSHSVFVLVNNLRRFVQIFFLPRAANCSGFPDADILVFILPVGEFFVAVFIMQNVHFFRSFNAIFSKVGRFASEHVILSLIRTKCLPVLLYGLDACPVFKRDKHSLDFMLTRLFMKLFRTGSPAIVAECQSQFNFLPVSYQVDIRTASFMFRYINSVNSICFLLSAHAKANLSSVLSCYGESVSSMYDLRSAIANILTK